MAAAGGCGLPAAGPAAASVTGELPMPHRSGLQPFVTVILGRGRGGNDPAPTGQGGGVKALVRRLREQSSPCERAGGKQRRLGSEGRRAGWSRATQVVPAESGRAAPTACCHAGGRRQGTRLLSLSASERGFV